MMCMVFTSLIMSVIVCNITSVACTVYTWCIPIGSKIHIFLEYIAIQLTAAQPIDSELLLSSFLSFTLSLALYFSIAASPLPPLSVELPFIGYSALFTFSTALFRSFLCTSFAGTLLSVPAMIVYWLSIVYGKTSLEQCFGCTKWCFHSNTSRQLVLNPHGDRKQSVVL